MSIARIADPGRHGSVSWVDLSTPDPVAAAAFYGRLFDWSVTTSTTPMGEYRIATVAGQQVCGIMGHPDGIEMPAVWTVFVTVDDLDSTLGAIGQHGGAVVQPPIEIPGGARVAVATDPAGAMFALVAGGPRPDAPYLTDAPGTVGWVEILTRDPLAAVPFYEGIFGWQTLSDEASGYTIFTLDGAATCGLLPMPAEVPAAAPSHWATYFAVSDCDRIAERCAALGGRILRPATTIATERFAVLCDGQGATFSVLDAGRRVS